MTSKVENAFAALSLEDTKKEHNQFFSIIKEIKELTGITSSCELVGHNVFSMIKKLPKKVPCITFRFMLPDTDVETRQRYAVQVAERYKSKAEHYESMLDDGDHISWVIIQNEPKITIAFCQHLMHDCFSTLDAVRLEVTDSNVTVKNKERLEACRWAHETKTIHIPNHETKHGAKRIIPLLEKGYSPDETAKALFFAEFNDLLTLNEVATTAEIAAICYAFAPEELASAFFEAKKVFILQAKIQIAPFDSVKTHHIEKVKELISQDKTEALRFAEIIQKLHKTKSRELDTLIAEHSFEKIDQLLSQNDPDAGTLLLRFGTNVQVRQWTTHFCKHNPSIANSLISRIENEATEKDITKWLNHYPETNQFIERFISKSDAFFRACAKKDPLYSFQQLKDKTNLQCEFLLQELLKKPCKNANQAICTLVEQLVDTNRLPESLQEHITTLQQYFHKKNEPGKVVTLCQSLYYPLMCKDKTVIQQLLWAMSCNPTDSQIQWFLSLPLDPKIETEKQIEYRLAYGAPTKELLKALSPDRRKKWQENINPAAVLEDELNADKPDKQKIVLPLLQKHHPKNQKKWIEAFNCFRCKLSPDAYAERVLAFYKMKQEIDSNVFNAVFSSIFSKPETLQSVLLLPLFKEAEATQELLYQLIVLLEKTPNKQKEYLPLLYTLHSKKPCYGEKIFSIQMQQLSTIDTTLENACRLFLETTVTLQDMRRFFEGITKLKMTESRLDAVVQLITAISDKKKQEFVELLLDVFSQTKAQAIQTALVPAILQYLPTATNGALFDKCEKLTFKLLEYAPVDIKGALFALEFKKEGPSCIHDPVEPLRNPVKESSESREYTKQLTPLYKKYLQEVVKANNLNESYRALETMIRVLYSAKNFEGYLYSSEKEQIEFLAKLFSHVVEDANKSDKAIKIAYHLLHVITKPHACKDNPEIIQEQYQLTPMFVNQTLSFQKNDEATAFCMSPIITRTRKTTLLESEKRFLTFTFAFIDACKNSYFQKDCALHQLHFLLDFYPENRQLQSLVNTFLNHHRETEPKICQALERHLKQTKGSDQSLEKFYEKVAKAETDEEFEQCVFDLQFIKETEGLTNEPYFLQSVVALLQKLQMQPDLLECDFLTKSVERLILPYFNCHSDLLARRYIEVHQSVSISTPFTSVIKFIKKARQGQAFENNFDTFCSLMQNFQPKNDECIKLYHAVLLLPVCTLEQNTKKFALIVSWLSKIPSSFIGSFLMTLFKERYLKGPNEEWIKKIGNALLERKDFHDQPLVQFTQKIVETNQNLQIRDSIIQWWISMINKHVDNATCRLHIFQVLLMALNLPGMNPTPTFVDHITDGIVERLQEDRIYKESTKFLVLKYPKKVFDWLQSVFQKAGSTKALIVFEEFVNQDVIGTYTKCEEVYIQQIHNIFKMFSQQQVLGFEARYLKQLTEYQKRLQKP